MPGIAGDSVTLIMRIFVLKPGRKHKIGLGDSTIGRPREGFTILELLVTMGIIGVLFALVLPAVQMARESVRCLQCQSQLKQVGLALFNYEETHNSFPAAWRTDPRHHSALGWATAILPQLDQEPLYDQIRQGPPLDRLDLANVRSTFLPIFVCPSDVTLQEFFLYAETEGHEANGVHSDEVLTNLPSANYVGVFGSRDPDMQPEQLGDGVFIGRQPIGMQDIQRGFSQTLLVGERTASKLPSTWLGFLTNGEDAPARVVGFANKGPNHEDADECEFSSRHPDCANFLWADGHVSSLSRSMNSALYRSLARRSR